MGCEKVCFTITGDGFTRTARDIWLSDMPGHATKTVMEGLIGCPSDIAIKLLTGSIKMEGDSWTGRKPYTPDGI